MAGVAGPLRRGGTTQILSPATMPVPELTGAVAAGPRPTLTDSSNARREERFVSDAIERPGGVVDRLPPAGPSPAVPRRPQGAPRWRVWRADLAAGAITAIVTLAIEGSYGLVALADLGPEHSQLAFLVAVHSAVLANVVMALVGVRGPLLSGPAAAMALLVPTLLAGLLADPRFTRPDGAPDIGLLLVVVSFGVLLGGVIQLIAGALRLGGIARYVPYPVLAGFMNGVAVLMAIAILPYALGFDSRTSMLADWSHAQPATAVVAIVTAWVALRPPAWTRRLPNYLVALVLGTALYYALRAGLGDAALGPVLGRFESAGLRSNLMAPVQRVFGDALWVDHVAALLRFAFAIAFIASLQGLLASSVVDGLTRTRRDGEHQLLALGSANVVVGLFGGLPVAGAVSRSKISLDSGGTGRLSLLAFGATLMFAVTLGAPVLSHLPLAVVAGLFVVAAYGLVDPWSRSATAALLAALGRRRAPAMPLQNYAVMLLVASVSVGISVAHGVATGVLLAMIAFVRSHSRSPVRAVAHAGQRHSLKVRSAACAALLREHGHRIALIELDGALFFGTADTVAREIDRIAEGADQVIVDFRRVTEVDASGARVLVQAVDALRAAGKQLWLASLDIDDARALRVREMDAHRLLSAESFFVDSDRALESAEDRLLGSFAVGTDAPPRMRLQDTMLGAGLTPAQLDRLEVLLVERHYGAGAPIFQQGEPSDALFVALRGEVGIWLPGEHQTADRRGRRVISFAPGVVFGEMGLLQGQPRSADAIAEDDDTLVLALSREALARLASEEHALLASIMLNLTCHLADRLRAQTVALQAALDHR